MEFQWNYTSNKLNLQANLAGFQVMELPGIHFLFVQPVSELD